ncbi:MAG: permease [Candidatus Marinimicrobia bacterium]|nr:permease [Candidatus Neomarinimicrobiota bacterium]
MEQNFRKFLLSMIGIVPAAFVLIGLFEVWVKRETVEKHMGEKAIFRGFFWAIVLAGTIIGGLYVSFPIAAALLKKGARSSVVFTFLFASTICRVPMTVFEANFLGVKFTLVRFLISLPLVIISSLFLGALVDKKRLLLPMIIKE